jgi:hypothetical protein
MREHLHKLADAAVAYIWSVFGFSAWVFSHLKSINEVLQFLLLIVSIFATLMAGLYNRRKRIELEKNKHKDLE